MREKCQPARPKAPVMIVRRIWEEGHQSQFCSFGRDIERVGRKYACTYVELGIPSSALCQDILLLGLLGAAEGVGVCAAEGGLADGTGGLKGGALCDEGHCGRRSCGGERRGGCVSFRR